MPVAEKRRIVGARWISTLCVRYLLSFCIFRALSISSAIYSETGLESMPDQAYRFRVIRYSQCLIREIRHGLCLIVQKSGEAFA